MKVWGYPSMKNVTVTEWAYGCHGCGKNAAKFKTERDADDAAERVVSLCAVRCVAESKKRSAS